MTTIAVNKDMMAADSLCDDGGTRMCVQKLYRVGGALVGFAGSLSQGLRFVRALRITPAGAVGVDPEEVGDGFDENFVGIILTPSGKIAIWEHFLEPIIVRQPFYAIGSGGDAALGAMYMGASPYEAVKVACKVNVGTGGKVAKLLRV